eukprot:SAG31_NODE_3268_length_4478_cov_2.701987_2_plen_107_part_00
MPSTRARPDFLGEASPAPELAPGSPQPGIVSAVWVQDRGGQAQGVDPTLLATLRQVVTSSMQTENSLLTAQLVTSRLGALEGVAHEPAVAPEIVSWCRTYLGHVQL